MLGWTPTLAGTGCAKPRDLVPGSLVLQVSALSVELQGILVPKEAPSSLDPFLAVAILASLFPFGGFVLALAGYTSLHILNNS